MSRGVLVIMIESCSYIFIQLYVDFYVVDISIQTVNCKLTSVSMDLDLVGARSSAELEASF